MVEVLAELDRLPAGERAAMLNAMEKLKVIGIQLGAQHSSHVNGTDLRELRPRQGRSPWRAFYRRVGERIVVGSVGPEALHQPKEFARAVVRASHRIASLEVGQAEGGKANA